MTFTDVVTVSEPYPSPKPSCSLDVPDCQALYAYNSSLIEDLYGESYYLCDLGTQTSSTGVPTSTFTPLAFGATPTTPVSNGTCNDCMVVAAEAQILYWPVHTKPGTGDDCDYYGGASVVTLNATRTGSGPNSFVTAGITITSPSVAIALTGVSRRDGCYGTVDTTVIPISAGEVKSIRGDLSFGYNTFAFNYPDLNYKCNAANASQYVANEPGDGCWPAVPASAYFWAPTTYAWYKNRTSP